VGLQEYSGGGFRKGTQLKVVTLIVHIIRSPRYIRNQRENYQQRDCSCAFHKVSIAPESSETKDSKTTLKNNHNK